MLVLDRVVGLAALLFALARWHRAGVHFHPLFQLQLMGLTAPSSPATCSTCSSSSRCMLAASYGLLLHGSGGARVRAGLHYIAVNLLASSLFLIGVAMLYGVTGTLNMADMAQQARRTSRRPTAACCTRARRSSASPSSPRRRCGR